MSTNFLILVAIDGDASSLAQSSLVSALQFACDGGMNCLFQVMPTSSGFTIVFERDAGDTDIDYLLSWISKGYDGKQAARCQLQSEIDGLMMCSENDPMGFSQAISDALESGKALVVDFHGVLNEVEEEFQNRPQTEIATSQFWRTNSGDLVQITKLQNGLPWIIFQDGTEKLLTAENLYFHGAELAGKKGLILQKIHTFESGSIPAEWSKPIESRQDAESFLMALSASGQLFHPEDDPSDVVKPSGMKLFDDDQAIVIRMRMAQVYYYMADPCDFCLSLGLNDVNAEDEDASSAEDRGPTMTKEEHEAIRSLREKGFAIALFYPTEFIGKDQKQLQDVMVQSASEFIDS